MTTLERCASVKRVRQVATPASRCEAPIIAPCNAFNRLTLVILVPARRFGEVDLVDVLDGESLFLPLLALFQKSK